MSTVNADSFYPCPFSKNYGIPVQQAWLLLKIFFSYRLIIAALFVVFFINGLVPAELNTGDKQLYFISSLVYLGIIGASLPFIFRQWGGYTRQAQIAIFTDIIFITLLMHGYGGVTSGIGILLVIPIAAGGMLIGGRCAILFAALASLAVLAEQIYAMLHNSEPSSTLSYSGMLGASYFAIALLSFIMAKRTEQSEQLANERQQTISKLEEINQHIIQHLQQGIIICDQHQHIQLKNEKLNQLLDKPGNVYTLTDITPILQQHFQAWLENPAQDFVIIPQKNNEIQARFVPLTINQESLYMIMIEDIALYNQRLQQSKLASLGRLTASIAHEIRNPLGAISHAAQLLSEADNLSEKDKRLTEIIHKQSYRVNEIIESILLLSRRSASKKELITLNQWLPDFVSSMVAEHGVDAETFNITMPDENISILTDPGHLRQILHNLCSNALKHNHSQDKTITLQVSREKDCPCIHVIDSGEKLDEDTCQHLFEPFFTTSSQGTGLGLYISRELAELNRAKLSYAYKNHKNYFTLCFDSSLQPLTES